MSGNYSYSITVPANTSKESAMETELVLSPGIIEQVSIGFPPGCSALAHLQIHNEEFQLFPQNKEGSYSWDNVIYTFYPMYKLGEKMPVLYAKTWNTDEFYEHTITLMLNVLAENRETTDLISLSNFLRFS